MRTDAHELQRNRDCGQWLDLRRVHPYTQQKSTLKKRLLALKSGPSCPNKGAGGRNAQYLSRTSSLKLQAFLFSRWGALVLR